jgi:predicted ATPase
VIHQLEKEGNAQFIIATRSPILMGYPRATIYDFDSSPLREICYEDTEHYQITKRFLHDTQGFLEKVLKD